MPVTVPMAVFVRSALASAALLIAIGACSRDVPPSPLVYDGMAAFVDTTVEFPRIRYEDGTVSMNDRCMVRQVKLNQKMGAVYVNGKPVGFC